MSRLEEMIRRAAVTPERQRIRDAFAPVHDLTNHIWEYPIKAKLKIGEVGQMVPVIMEDGQFFVEFDVGSVLRQLEEQLTIPLVESAKDKAVVDFFEKVQKLD
jgi:hypothetical protein